MSIARPISARNWSVQRRHQPVIMKLWQFAVCIGVGSLLLSCATDTNPVQAELYPETQQPHFKTCATRVGGTYRERELQKHQVIDIYLEPAPDEGPMTEECIVRE